MIFVTAPVLSSMFELRIAYGVKPSDSAFKKATARGCGARQSRSALVAADLGVGGGPAGSLPPVVGHALLAAEAHPLEAQDTAQEVASEAFDGVRVLGLDRDGVHLYVQTSSTVPVNIVRIDTLTGERTFWRELTPIDQAGVFITDYVRFSANGAAHTYSNRRVISGLVLMEGLDPGR